MTAHKNNALILTLASSELIATGVKRISFNLSDHNFDFIPGQYLNLLIKLENEIYERSFSIASNNKILSKIELIVTSVTDSKISEYLFNLEPGSTIEAKGPYGELVLNDFKNKRLFLISTGSGIAPHRSMLFQLIDNELRMTKTEIISVVRSREHRILFKEFIEASLEDETIDFINCYSEKIYDDLNEWEVCCSIIDLLKTKELKSGQDIFYLCGNQKIIDQIFKFLISNNIMKEEIKFEGYKPNV